MRRPLIGALWAILATAGAGAVHGAIARVRECSATADALTSAMIFMVVYVAVFGVPASIFGAILGWVLKRRGEHGSRSGATKPKMQTDDLV